MKRLYTTAFLTALTLCTPAFAADVVVGVPNWPSVEVTANVIKAIVEQNLGLKAELQTGTNERDQHLVPRALRNVSSMARRVYGDFRLDPWTVAKIVDVGDVPFPCANDNEDCIERIAEFFRRVDATGARPISVGGDHSITGGIVQAIC